MSHAMNRHDPAAVTYSGHASTVIEMDGVRLLTDPVYRSRVIHLRRQVAAPDPTRMTDPDAVLVSHQHFDHLDLPSLRGFGPDVRILAAPGCAGLLRKKGFRNVQELDVGRSTMVGTVTVTAVPAEHDGNRRPLGSPGRAVGFLVEGSSSVYFAGDTDLYDEMASHLEAVDVALLPVWGWGHTLGPGHMDPERAAEAAGLIRPRLAIPIHWGTLFPIGLARTGRRHLEKPPYLFAARVPDYSPGTEVRVLLPGESTPLPDAPDGADASDAPDPTDAADAPEAADSPDTPEAADAS
jgi:L-ascorbate metabolism protein UlaG (beta-lactamase superfamily)